MRERSRVLRSDAMRDLITAGDVLVQEGTNMPRSLLAQTGAESNGWTAIRVNLFTFEKTVEEAGWTFFFMAGEIKVTVFGFDRQRALRTALKRLITDVKSQHCNGIEITGVVGKSFWRIPYVNVSAHARHLQKDRLFSGSSLALPSLPHSNGG
jgi:hypothetical protein